MLVYFSDPKVLEQLDALAEKIGKGRGEAIRVLQERAAGNFQSVRHGVRGHLQAARMQLSVLRRDFPSREEFTAVDRAIAQAAALLAAPVPTGPAAAPPPDKVR